MSSMSSEVFGKEAYQKMLVENHKEAVSILNSAIAKFPDDCRLYTNRCYSYIELDQLHNALSDAQHLVQKFPQYSKGWFLYGEVFLLQGKYKEAEEKFSRAISLEPIAAAHERLFECQVNQILARGYSVPLSRKALKMTRNVQEALSCLSQGLISGERSKHQLTMELTPEEEAHLARELGKVTAAAVAKRPTPVVVVRRPAVPTVSTDPLLDPANPLKSNSLWVGNMTEKATQAKLKALFSKYGSLLSIHLQPEKFCAFVNYAKPESAGAAMKGLQGTPFDGKSLLIKYPDNKLKR